MEPVPVPWFIWLCLFTVVLGLKANTLASESKRSHKFYKRDLPTFESRVYTYIDTIGFPR